MTTTATLVYKVEQTNVLMSALENAMRAVQYKPEILSALGVFISSDVTSSSGSNAVRTTILALVPTVGAAVAAHLVPGLASGSPVQNLTIVTNGSGYVRPPILSMPAPSNGRRAVAKAYLDVDAAAVVAGGTGYSAGTQAVFSGGGGPKTVQATATLTIGGGGVITGIAVTSSGSGYTSPPTVTLIDPAHTGSGAVISVDMEVGEVVLVDGGLGYTAPPAVTVTPFFKSLFPDTPDAPDPNFNQTKPFYSLLTQALKQALVAPVVSEDPVIA